MKASWVPFGFLVTVPMAAIGPGGCQGDDELDSEIRTYYVAADEVWWDYAPQGHDLLTGEAFTEAQRVFVGGALFEGSDDPKVAPTPISDANPNFVPYQVGKVYLKAIYRAYTDDSFTTLAPIPEAWKHLGSVGPVLRGAVGDTIRVVFKNNSATHGYSIHPHGVFYGKDSEGTPYQDGTSDDDEADDIVPPGGTHVYTWEVPERAGPGPDDPSSIVWLYHSHSNEPVDTNSGLIGPIIITRSDMANPDATPRDVDREFVNLFTIYDENASWYRDDNLAAAGIDPSVLENHEVFSEAQEEALEESNLMHTINGFVYGNMMADTLADTLPMTMRRGQLVRWYIVGMGTEVDLHTPHWHGHTVVTQGHSTDVVELLPASMKTVDMRADNEGIWMYHCHVNDHIAAGMMTRYEVLP